MLIGLIADVHSNAIALKEMLFLLKELDVKKILHAGDVVGYNPYPNETIELFKKNRIISILGNHDRALITRDVSGFNPYAAYALRWTINEVSSENLDYILGLGDVESMKEKVKITLVHGSPYDFDEYVYPEYVVPEFLHAVESDILVLGHTHIQFKKEYAEGIVVNPGSVGQPRDGNPDAAFAILDTESGKVELKRIGYDVEKVVEDMLKEKLPHELAYRLRSGY